MTTKPTDTQFFVRICGIDYADAVALCGSRFRKFIDNWCANEDDDDCNTDGDGIISIPVANISDLIDLLSEINGADNWTDCHEWDIALHVNRMSPSHNILGHLAESGASLVLQPCRPAISAVDEALSKMQAAMADLRAAASMLEPPQ